MAPSANEPVLLSNYRTPAYQIDTTHLDFALDDIATVVTARLSMRRRSDETGAPALRLDGEELSLLSIAVNDRELSSNEYTVDDSGLTVHAPPAAFVLQTQVRIDPKHNTSLEGLYLSSGNFCTQCEAEGFRKITYYLDRPDVLARFTTTIRADRDRYPVLLANGNLIDEGTDGQGRHRATWEDPYPKPSYLFALVAGQLQYVGDSYVTRSGRKVDLRIYVEPHNIDKCDHAMASLKRSMRWDEEVYGLEYDLDIFMVVAVDDFNMGAMENKGLNIFNSKYVLASPDTATDADFTAIEAIIAHEYFHNWTGNRVTCRDWFQLSLKEGLTVFRDQEFSADMGSRAVKRIQDVRILRNHQFREDSGPMAHPVRPDSYIEINNFYTVTIYNKGAEVIRMIHTLVGAEGFRRGMDLYFARHDGAAVTTDDFVSAMEDANDVDLRRFRRWYTQAGTPVIHARESFDADSGQLEITLEQSCPPTPGQAEKKPFHIPLKLALIGPDGSQLALSRRLPDSNEFDAGNGAHEHVVELLAPVTSLRVEGLSAAPHVSLGRGFSAPVRIETEWSPAKLAFAMGLETDPFNRWDAAQEYSLQVLQSMLEAKELGQDLPVPHEFVTAFERTLRDATLDPALAAEALRLPSEANIADRLSEVNPVAVHAVRQRMKEELASALREPLQATYQRLRTNAPYRFAAEACAQRSLKNLCLDYLMTLQDDAVRGLCQAQFDSADNMTDTLAALGCFANDASGHRVRALTKFRERWASEPLVIDKWFSLRATSCLPGTLEDVKQLMGDPNFELKNPNRVRALIGTFCHANPLHFHAADGQGYEFARAQVLALDPLNPQVAARLLSAFSQWRRYEPHRQEMMQRCLAEIVATPGLSGDCYEIASKTLAG